MGLMAMQMTGSNGILSVPSEHLPGLVALVLITPAMWVALWALRTLASHPVPWAARFVARLDALSVTAKVTVFASLVGAVVHAAIVPTHWTDEHTTALLFILDAAGFVFAIAWTIGARRHWRLIDVAILAGTAGAYGLYVLKGWESVDLVGLLTTTVELAGALLILSPASVPSSVSSSNTVPAALRDDRERWIGVAAVPLALVSLLGTAAIAGAVQTPSTASGMSPTGGGPSVPGGAGSRPGKGAAATSSRPGMSSMPGMSSPGTASPGSSHLSLATTSPAGSVVWPDDMAAMAPGMEMATPNCVAQPTSAQQAAAVSLVDKTVAAVAPYRNLSAAKAAGYIPVTRTGAKIVHYINPSIYRDGRVLDPDAIPALVYVNTSHGAVLSAAMYLMPRSGAATPPQPGGCLTQWHIHTDLCFSAGTVVGNDTTGACAAGSANETTAPMMHIWLAPVSGGPLAPDPPAPSEVQAADALPAVNPPNATA